MAGSISTLGVGSGLQLQDIIDKLRAVDQKVVDRKKDEITKFESQLDEFTTVKNKLLTMKSAALNLSLSGSFIGRTVSSSSESAITATVTDGATVKSSAITVTHLAQQSSWMSSSGVAATNTSVYVPTRQNSSGVTNPATDPIASSPGNLTITFGGSSTIAVAVGSGTVLDDGNPTGTSLVALINNHADNAGKVTASTYTEGSQTFLRIDATSGGNGEANRVAITTNNTNLTLAPPDKTLVIQVGADVDDRTTLSVAADTTLSQLVEQINDATDNPGLTAATINDGLDPDTPYRLSLTANSYGEDHRITFLSQLPDLLMAEQAEQAADNDALNSQFTVDGISYQRQSNTMNDVLSGVTLTLKEEDSSTITVANNDAGLKEMITSLVTAYNDVVQEVREKSAYDTETGAFGILRGTTLRDLPFELEGLMTTFNSADPEGTITSLFDLGLEFDRDGTITMDETTLSAAIRDHRDGVQAFFQGDSDNDIEGLADKINDRLRTMTSASGFIEGEKSAAQARIDDLNLKFAEESARLDRRYAQLTKQFVALDSYMNEMTSMSNFLTGQFNSLSDGWSGSSNSNNG